MQRLILSALFLAAEITSGRMLISPQMKIRDAINLADMLVQELSK